VVTARDDERLDASPGLRRCSDQALEVDDGDDVVGIAVDEEDRPIVRGERRRGADRRDPVATGAEVDARGQPGEGIGDRIREREVGQPKRLARQPLGVCRR